MQTGLYTERMKTALRDGREVEIRVLAPDDGERLRRLFFLPSPRRGYRRFLSPLPRPREEGLRRLLDVDHRDREALAAIHDDEILAVAPSRRQPGPDVA